MFNFAESSVPYALRDCSDAVPSLPNEVARKDIGAVQEEIKLLTTV